MSAPLNFEDVLDEALAAQGDTGVAGGARYWTGPPPTFFLPFGAPRSAPLPGIRQSALGIRVLQISGQRPAQRAAVAEGRVPNTECRVPTRVLTARHQEALDHLVSLGARLGVDFTARELRSAFRQLARRYHPDRHHGGSTTEIAQVTRVFATMSAHYQCLLVAIE